MGKIRVLVASDYQIVRSALRQLLKIDDAFDVLMTETSLGKALPRTCQTTSPDVLLLKVATHSSSSLRSPAGVLNVVADARILVLSTNDNTTYVRAVFATGALGYILKTGRRVRTVPGCQTSSPRSAISGPPIEQLCIDHLLSRISSATGQPGKQLSRREIEVLGAIALGFTRKEISKELDLSEKNVQTYRERIYRMLAFHTRADLVHYAVAHGLAGWEDSS